MASIIQLLRKIGGVKAAPTTGEAGQLAIWKAGAKTTDATSLYAHDGTQWIEVIDTRGQVVAPKLTTIATTAPGTPQPGDMWLNTATNLLSIWDGATWCTTDTHQAATSVLAPVNPTTGSMWLDPGKKDLMVWDGSQWANVAFKNVTNTFTQPQNIDVNSASAALHIKQLGAGAALFIEDETNPDATPFVVDASGNVGIGADLTLPNAYFIKWKNRAGVAQSILGLDGSDDLNYGPGGSFVGNHFFYSGGVQRFRIDGLGLLHSHGYQYNGYPGAGKYYEWVNRDGHGFDWTVNATTRAMRINEAGEVIIGANPDRSFTSNLGVKIYPTGQLGLVTGANADSTVTLAVYSTLAGDFRFYVGAGGTVFAKTTSISGISDVSLKENIRDIDTGLDTVNALRPVRFDWKGGDGKNVAGFVAQEVELIMPDLVSDYLYKEGETKKSLKMGDMMPTAIKAIQELSAKIDKLEARLAVLEARP